MFQNDSCLILYIAHALVASLPVSSLQWWLWVSLIEINIDTG